MNPLDGLEGAAQDGDVMGKIDTAHGKYRDGTAEGDLMNRLPQASMPQAPDPSPFSLGPIGGK